MIIDSHRIYEKVQKLLSRYQSNHPHRICKELGIKIYYRDFQDLLGMYTIVQRQRCIFLKNNLNEQQERIVLAHELGHDQLHRSLVREIGFIRDHTLMNTNEQAEIEANLFAAHLLIKNTDLEEYYQNDYTDEQIAANLKVPLSLLLLKEKYPVQYSTRRPQRLIPDTTKILHCFKNEAEYG